MDDLTCQIEAESLRIMECFNSLTEQEMGLDRKHEIWKAPSFSGQPNFYPVYHWNGYYSYSPLHLIRQKGELRLNPQAKPLGQSDAFRYCLPHRFIDLEIDRIGGPPAFRPTITCSNEYARRIAAAMRWDVEEIEAQLPGSQNVILCGGKDSLNLLLLPWKNPTMVASSAPNFQLVQQFIFENDLDFEVIELLDEAPDLNREILANCCRNNLEHCRWSAHLERIARESKKPTVFWKGQLGDVVMSEKWQKYPVYDVTTIQGHGSAPSWIRRLKKIASPLRRFSRRVHQPTRPPQTPIHEALWFRGAMYQGAHMSLIRELTGGLVLSGYHGPRVQEVIASVDFERAVSVDVRPLVGQELKGEQVHYPDSNPTPPPSPYRRNCSDVGSFMKALKAIGIRVR